MEVARNAPVAGGGLPLVVVSHGNGGGPQSHADLALALASAGYVVAAPMHTGDNFFDQSAAGQVVAQLFSHCNANRWWNPCVTATTTADTGATMIAECRAPKRIGAKRAGYAYPYLILPGAG
ncbi:MAG: hypothetical protein MZW92_32090 [Comamonadaceae bacterium]|nr:hypothetical protein [Comamonadaceae bacterium]